MTIIPWPPAGKPPRPARKMIVDPLPQSILHSFVNDIPGPKNETPAERAVRYEAQMAEVLSYNPRNSADAMLATHCVLLRLVAQDSHRDAARPGIAPALMKKFLRSARQFEKLAVDMAKTLARRQAQPLGRMDPAIFQSLGMTEFLIPDPDDPAQPDQAVSAVIVPLHPAPKMLQ